MDEQKLYLAFGRRVKELRKQCGLSQDELGKLIDKSQDTVSNIETGRAGTRLETTYAIAQALNVELSQLFTLTAEPDPRQRLLDDILDRLRDRSDRHLTGVRDILNTLDGMTQDDDR
ncbi:MAG: hypothetical protein Alpg2KO_34090 [Alphaproteobacteria bacterium]